MLFDWQVICAFQASRAEVDFCSKDLSDVIVVGAGVVGSNKPGSHTTAIIEEAFSHK